jgi:hypothetical protein
LSHGFYPKIAVLLDETVYPWLVILVKHDILGRSYDQLVDNYNPLLPQIGYPVAKFRVAGLYTPLLPE